MSLWTPEQYFRISGDCSFKRKAHPSTCLESFSSSQRDVVIPWERQVRCSGVLQSVTCCTFFCYLSNAAGMDTWRSSLCASSGMCGMLMFMTEVWWRFFCMNEGVICSLIGPLQCVAALLKDRDVWERAQISNWLTSQAFDVWLCTWMALHPAGPLGVSHHADTSDASNSFLILDFCSSKAKWTQEILK